MHVLLCLDDRNGMLFHNRRQSRDRTVIQNIRRTAEKSRLWIAPISLVLFQGDEKFLSVDPFPLKRAKAGEFCFMEDSPLLPYVDKLESVPVYRWNRVYPADFHLDFPVEKQWRLAFAEDFPGYSHEKITKEVYLP